MPAGFFYRKKKKKVRHESFEKNPKKSPALRQVSVGGVSNRGFMPSLSFNNADDNGRTAHTPNGFPSFYGVPSEISSTGSMEVDLKKPVKDGSIVFENEDVYYDNNGKVNMYEVPNEGGTEVDGRRPSQDGSVVFESKEGHYDNIGKMNTNDVPEVDGRKPTQDGNVGFGKKEVHFAKNGQIIEGLAFDV